MVKVLKPVVLSEKKIKIQVTDNYEVPLRPGRKAPIRGMHSSSPVKVSASNFNPQCGFLGYVPGLEFFLRRRQCKSAENVKFAMPLFLSTYLSGVSLDSRDGFMIMA